MQLARSAMSPRGDQRVSFAVTGRGDRAEIAARESGYGRRYAARRWSRLKRKRGEATCALIASRADPLVTPPPALTVAAIRPITPALMLAVIHARSLAM
jgi:hypothetical protein